MTALTHQRCFNHARREAAARCVECGRFYCRECVTEHQHRVICAACLQRLTAGRTRRRSPWRVLGRVAGAALGVAVLWLTFFLIAELLLSIPDDFHEGRVWKAEYWEEP